MRVTIVIPTLNEEKSIGDVIKGFKELGFRDILVIDGRSKDKTREIASKEGAKVVIQSGKGKGQAVQEALKIVDSDILVLVDGDGTYDPKDVFKLIEPIKKGLADHVLGNRLEFFEKGAFTRLNLIGNKILNFLFRVLYGENIKDLLTGYRALSKKLYKSLNLRHEGFEVETEMTVQTIAKGFKIMEIPVRYKKRKGHTKLRPLSDGFRIGKAIIFLLFEYLPGKALYLIGILLLVVGIAFGIKTVVDWFNHISHTLLATLTTLLIISGLLFILFGVIISSLLRVVGEVREEVRELKRVIEERYKSL